MFNNATKPMSFEGLEGPRPTANLYSFSNGEFGIKDELIMNAEGRGLYRELTIPKESAQSLFAQTSAAIELLREQLGDDLGFLEPVREEEGNLVYKIDRSTKPVSKIIPNATGAGPTVAIANALSRVLSTGEGLDMEMWATVTARLGVNYDFDLPMYLCLNHTETPPEDVR